MYIRRSKKLVWIWPITVLLVSLAMVSVSLCASTALVSAPTIIDPTKTPGSTFSIDITIANVESLWGFDFVLYYNTTVLTATDYSSYDPFTLEHPSEINDTAGLASVAYSMPMGEEVGFSTVDAVPVAKIDFTVDSTGNSTLIFEHPVSLPDVEAGWIPSEVFDGFFANVAMEAADIAVTSVTASPTTVLVTETVTVTVTVENQGDVDATFNVTAYYDSTFIETRTNVTLSTGTDTTLTFNWNTTGVAEGTHTIKAQVPQIPGEIDIADNTKVDGTVTVTTEGEDEAPDFVLYAVAGIAIVIVVAIVLVYFLKIRKPKPT